MSEDLIRRSDAINVITEYIGSDFPTEEMARESATMLVETIPTVESNNGEFMTYETYLRQQVDKGCYGVAIISAEVALDIANFIEKQRERIAEADRKTENSSEKPNNCEDLQDWKDRMWAEAIVTEPTISKMEQVDEPQTDNLATAIANEAYCRTCKHLLDEDCDCDIVFTGYESKESER